MVITQPFSGCVGSSDILVVTETHESPMHPPLGYHGYQWLLVCRDEVRMSGGVRGSRGVACLVQNDIFQGYISCSL